MSEPKERPILFSAPMIRAILDGKKTMTRRIVKPPQTNPPLTYDDFLSFQPGKDPCVWWRHGWYSNSPYGWAGEKLWVRETFYPVRKDWVVYRADTDVPYNGKPWRPSIHMPRWASRITLEVTAVRVERLQDITTGDVIAEGLMTPEEVAQGAAKYNDKAKGTYTNHAFADLWDALNAKRGYGWVSNPYVWVVSFKKL